MASRLIYGSAYSVKHTLGGQNHGINKQLKKQLMGNLLYTVAVILIILWAIGFLGYNIGGLIHILLVIAVIAVLFKIIRG